MALASLQFTDAAASAEQQRFNKLLERTETLACKIQATQAIADAHRIAFSSTLRPLQLRVDELHREMALWLDSRLRRKDLTAKQQRLARELICNLTTDLALAGDAEMRALHDANNAKTLAEHERAHAADMQAMLEGMLGKTLGPKDAFANSEDVLAASRVHMHAQAEEHAQAREDQAARRKRRPKPAHKKLAEQQAMDADSALRTIYRQLASALHPDREIDPAERTRKHTLMSEANAAYARRDLLALLQLQLRAELADGAKVGRLARDKLAALTLLLQQRVEVLTHELYQLERRTLAEFGMRPHGPFSAAGLKRQMQEQQRNLKGEIALMENDLRRVQDDARFKRWLVQQHELAQQQDDFADPVMRMFGL